MDTKSPRIDPRRGYINEVPRLEKEMEEFIEKRLREYEDNKTFFGGSAENFVRNRNIIKWHFAGFGFKKITKLMQYPLAAKTLENVLETFKRRIEPESLSKYNEYRAINQRRLASDEDKIRQGGMPPLSDE